MILYFSGTGNSEYVAKRISKMIQDEVMNLFYNFIEKDNAKVTSQRPWVIVVPTYAWRIPRIVHTWIRETKFTGNKNIYFVMTCGDSIGNAGKYLKRLCAEKNMNYYGCIKIIMPENYIALFTTPTKDKALQIIDQAESIIDHTALTIKKGMPLPHTTISFMDRIKSGIVNYLFYPVMVHAKKFYASDHCISCGQCVNVCPLNNIQLKKGKPVWGKHCTHCMACINRCPKEAIEYGKHSLGLPRYTCDKDV